MTKSMALGIDGIDTSVGTHLCGFYHGREELESMLFPYLEAGVRDGEKTVCLIDSQRPEQVLDALRPGVNVEAALAAHQLEVKHSTESYLSFFFFHTPARMAYLLPLPASSLD